MTYFRNDAKGYRKVRLSSGGSVGIEPGETKYIPAHRATTGIPAGLTEVEPQDISEAEFAAMGDDLELEPAPAGLLLADEPSAPPPALAGLTKAQLLDVAQREGVLIEHVKGTGANGFALAEDIRNAIETKRAN